MPLCLGSNEVIALVSDEAIHVSKIEVHVVCFPVTTLYIGLGFGDIGRRPCTTCRQNRTRFGGTAPAIRQQESRWSASSGVPFQCEKWEG